MVWISATIFYVKGLNKSTVPHFKLDVLSAYLLQPQDYTNLIKKTHKTKIWAGLFAEQLQY